MVQRSREIDGIRGLLALAVLIFHVSIHIPGLGTDPSFVIWSNLGAMAAVGGFFVISGYVLGPIAVEPIAFISRRTRRLVPMHLVCMAAGAVVLPWAASDLWRDELWLYPWRSSLDGPDWSLRIEMLATVVWPVIALAARRAPLAIAFAIIFPWLGRHLWVDLNWMPLFVFGARMWLAGMQMPSVALLRTRPVQALGRISFSLYMTHLILIQAWGPWIGAAAAIPIACAAYILVERPSHQWSRRANPVRQGRIAYGACATPHGG